MKLYDKNSSRSPMNLTPPDTPLDLRQLTTRQVVKPGFLDRIRLNFTLGKYTVAEEIEQAEEASHARRRINRERIEQCEAVAGAMIKIESAERQQTLFAEANEKAAQSISDLRQGCFDRLKLNAQWYEFQKHEVAALVESGTMSEECAQLLLEEAKELLLTQARNDKQTTNALADYQGRLASLVRDDDDGSKGRRR